MREGELKTMDKEKHKVPNLRFKGFTDDWEKRKLGDFGKVAMNKRIFKNQTSDEGDVPFYKIGTFGGVADSYITKELFEEYKLKYPYPRKGDLLISASGSIGRVIEYNGKDEYFQDSNIVWLDHDNRLDNSFLKQFYNIIKWQGLEGSTIKRLYNKNILATKIDVPSISEQLRIGNFLQQFDTLITLHQQKLDRLNNLKKGLLQQMFADKDQKQPELRFKGFTDDWEQHKLGDLGSVQMNKRIFKDQTSESGEVPFFKIGTFGKKPDSFITKKLFDEYKSKYPYPEVGDILISASGSIGRTVVYKGEDAYFQDSNIVWIEHDSRLKNSFLEQFLKRTKWNKIEGSTIKRLYNKDILNKKINLPDQQEQSTIGNFFKQLDFLITLHQRKLDSLNKLKTGLLQQMFI